MMKISSLQAQITNKQNKTAFQVSVITFVITVFMAVYYTLIQTDSNVWTLSSANTLATIIAIASFISTILNRRGHSILGILLVLLSFAFSLTLVILFSAGMDILLIAITLVVFFGISSTTLPQQLVSKAIFSSVFLALLFVVIGFIEPFERTFYPSDLATTLLSLLFFLIYGVLIFRQFPSYTLRVKIILTFVFLSSVGISVAFVFANSNMRTILISNAQERLLAGSSASAQNIDTFLKYSTDTLITATAYLDLRSYFLLSPKERVGSQTERQVQNLLYSLNNRNPDVFSYGLLDLNGINVADSHTANIGIDESEQDYFQLPLNANTTYISPVLYFPDEDKGFLFFSAPVHNDMGIMVGILRAQYHASVLQNLISTQKNVAGEGTFSALFDSNHILLAHGANPDLIGKISFTPNTQEIEQLRENFLLPYQISDQKLSLNIPAIEEGLSTFASTPYFSSEETALGLSVSGAITQLENVPWLVATTQPQAIFLAPVQQQTQQASLAAITLIILAAFSALGLANVLVAPIRQLQSIAQQFAEGNLNVKASVNTNDEIGSLALTFNDLSSRLSATVETLESRVEERTKGLEAHTNYLEGAAEVSAAVGSIMDPDVLITEVVQLIKDHFDLYYTGLFLVDNNNEWAVLKAGTDNAGQIMLRREHKIKIGEGMIGWSIENAEARIALDVGDDAVRFENPNLPETRSEGALPLRSRGRVLGALTVQSVEESAFTSEIITTLQTMTDQIAIALDNAELFVKTEAALLSERKAYGELSQRSWRELTQSQTFPHFIVDEDGKTSSTIKTDEILEDDGLTAIIPIKNREHTLGGIKIRKKKNATPWTKEELEITQALSENLSVALESARLFDKAQRKAQREAVLSDISSKISASSRMDAILRTTVQELGQALNSPEVTLELINPSDNAENDLEQQSKNGL